MRCTKFKRHKIQRALELLKQTGLDAWSNIEILDENLNAWDEEGDLCDTLARHGVNHHVVERDEEGNVLDVSTVDNSNNSDTNESVSVVQDGADSGPAPLQNSEVPEETFEGVVNFDGISTVSAGNATRATEAVNNLANQIRNNHQNGSVGIEPQFTNANQTTAIFAQKDGMPTDGFANMNTNKYAWAMTFPSVFIPRYTMVDGKMRWTIFHDLTGWEGPRDKHVDFKSWCEYMMWRSDGVPAVHTLHLHWLSSITK